ncbi:hypothetical protein [Lacipirellula sp.]|uniref:hypothetical protein n=1 Tax=Lacipirellula sp. TaxID=2691419 RepID=UPI003D12BD13
MQRPTRYFLLALDGALLINFSVAVAMYACPIFLLSFYGGPDSSSKEIATSLSVRAIPSIAILLITTVAAVRVWKESQGGAVITLLAVLLSIALFIYETQFRGEDFALFGSNPDTIYLKWFWY